MAEIPSLAYIIIGAFLVIASLVINPKKLLLFIIVGVIMIIIGILKLMGEKRTKKSHTPHTAVHHTVRPPPTTHHQTRVLKHCPRCGTSGQTQAVYCPRCGTRLVPHRR